MEELRPQQECPDAAGDAEQTLTTCSQFASGSGGSSSAATPLAELKLLPAQLKPAAADSRLLYRRPRRPRP